MCQFILVLHSQIPSGEIEPLPKPLPSLNSMTLGLVTSYLHMEIHPSVQGDLRQKHAPIKSQETPPAGIKSFHNFKYSDYTDSNKLKQDHSHVDLQVYC